MNILGGTTLADRSDRSAALLEGSRAAIDRLASKLLKPLNNNFVERPWGGMQMLELKGMPGARARAGLPIGEAFEISADDRDPEARRYPSRIRFGDGSELPLPRLLEQHADALLGPRFRASLRRVLPAAAEDSRHRRAAFGASSSRGQHRGVRDHRRDAGATIRLGFNADVDPGELERRLGAGRRDQQRLLELLVAGVDQQNLQQVLKPWLAQRNASTAALEPALRPLLRDGTRAEAATTLSALHALYWEVLDSLNEIAVAPGQVIHNSNPRRIVAATGRAASAEVHALGNPEGREILALEIRRPGPTFRAWDNVRYPLRDIDIAGALAALNLRRTAPDEFSWSRGRSRAAPGARFPSIRSIFGSSISRPRPAMRSTCRPSSRTACTRSEGR